MAKRKIYVGPADNANSTQPLKVEGLVVDAFLPGTLVKETASGLATTDIAATVFNNQALVAEEQGANVGADIDTAWTIGETGRAVVARSGEFVNVFVAAGNNITTTGTPMSSNGDGTLKIAATTSLEQHLFVSDEIVNVTGSAALVRMRRL